MGFHNNGFGGFRFDHYVLRFSLYLCFVGLNRTTKDQRRAETDGRGTAPIGSRCRGRSRAIACRGCDVSRMRSQAGCVSSELGRELSTSRI